jgi:hypothetical protein
VHIFKTFTFGAFARKVAKIHLFILTCLSDSLFARDNSKTAEMIFIKLFFFLTCVYIFRFWLKSDLSNFTYMHFGAHSERDFLKIIGRKMFSNKGCIEIRNILLLPIHFFRKSRRFMR